MAQSSTVEVSIVHDHALLRESLARSLGRFRGLKVVSGLSCAKILEPAGANSAVRGDVAILGYGGVDTPGLTVSAQLKVFQPALRILMIDVPSRDEDILATIKAGAAGYLTIDAGISELVGNIRAVAKGRAVCSSRITRLLFAHVASPQPYPAQSETKADQLTRRELQVMVLIEEGLSNKEIARRLQIEQQTVKNHVHSILVKLALRRRTQVAHFARCNGLVPATTVY